VVASLRGTDGKVLTASVIQITRAGASGQLSLMWFARLHGDYTLTVTVRGQGELSRFVQVP
jgi:hypothetical protein